MRKTTIIIGLILQLLLLSGKVLTQVVDDFNLRRDYPAGLSFYLGGASIIGASLDYFVTPNVNVELTFGSNISGGLKYHFLGHKHYLWSPYVGVLANVSGQFAGFETRSGFYFPIGVHYIAVKSFSFALEAG